MQHTTVYIVVGHWPVFRDNAPSLDQTRIEGVYTDWRRATGRASNLHDTYHIRTDVIEATVNPPADDRAADIAWQFGDFDDGSEALRQARQRED